MSPLGSIAAALPVARVAPQNASSSGGRLRAPTQEPQNVGPLAAPRLSALSPQATIRQAEMLLQIVATNASSPALRQIAAAAYQMEIDARREIAVARTEAATSGREWFA